LLWDKLKREVKMKTKISIVLNILMVILILLPFSKILFNGTSFYFSPLGLSYCSQPEQCRHEVGHLIDDDMGHISRSREFGEAIVLHLFYQIKYEEKMDRFSGIILTNPGMLIYSPSYQPYKTEAGSSPQEELYAKLYAEVDGDIEKLPPSLRIFYRDDTEYDDAYDRLITKKIYIDTRRYTMDKIKEMLKKVGEKIEENKETVIRVSAVFLGAVIGGAIATVISNQQNLLDEEVTMEMIEDEDETSE
jgi:hypothetical protein